MRQGSAVRHFLYHVTVVGPLGDDGGASLILFRFHGLPAIKGCGFSLVSLTRPTKTWTMTEALSFYMTQIVECLRGRNGPPLYIKSDGQLIVYHRYLDAAQVGFV